MKKLEDYRKISICPQAQELLTQEQPILRKNAVTGDYITVDQYCDIHFRLFRENFIRPLRENVSVYRNNRPKSKSDVVLDRKLNVYRNVQLVGVQRENSACQTFNFDCTPFQKGDWEVINRVSIFLCTVRKIEPNLLTSAFRSNHSNPF